MCSFLPIVALEMHTAEFILLSLTYAIANPVQTLWALFYLREAVNIFLLPPRDIEKHFTGINFTGRKADSEDNKSEIKFSLYFMA